jgi:hypothetical protein
VNFVDLRKFPEGRIIQIGLRTDTRYSWGGDSPGPDYVPREREERLYHKIQSHCGTKQLEDTSHIGPGKYDPDYTWGKGPAFKLGGGPKRRSGWMTDNEKNPGPGAYNTDLKETIRTEPRWTIGRRSRKSTKNSGGIHRDLIAVDQAIIHLENLPNPAAARLYIMTHPELSRIVHDILGIVLEAKPEDPLVFIHEFLREIIEDATDQLMRSSADVVEPPLENG